MAENADGQEKSEPASGKRLGEARDKGQVSKSQDVTSAVVLLVGSGLVYSFGPGMLNNVQLLMKDIFRNSSIIDITDKNAASLYLSFILILGKILLPLLGVLFAIIFVAEVSQIGLHFATKKFTEGLNLKSILNPISGAKKMMFSSRSAFELLKSFAKMSIIGVVVYNVMIKHVDNAIKLIEKPFNEIGSFLGSVSLELAMKVGAIYILIAAADFIFQKWKFKNDMKMTKQETKEEGKQAEGDPKIKSRIRSIMRARLRNIMLKNVKTSDVVITNPTHFAVALKYDPLTMAAPVLMAKGADFLAKQIIKIAEESDVLVIQQPPLARALFFNIEVNQEIPENLFKTVAQVLAYVFQLKNKKIVRK